MARPIKTACDYFSHDAAMRNHRKIKAVRNKYGVEGYAVWVMFLEYLTASDGNQSEYSEIEFELLSGDFGLDAELINLIIDYCLTLGLLQLVDGFVRSSSLDERLEPVYLKRGRMRDLALSRFKKQTTPPKTTTTVNPLPSKDDQQVSDTPASKNQKAVKRAKKGKKQDAVDLTSNLNVDFEFFWNDYDKKVGDKEKLKRKWEELTEYERESVMVYIPEYKKAQPDKSFRKNPETFLNNKSWNDEIIRRNTKKQSGKSVSEKFNTADTLIDAMFNGKERL